MNLPVFRIALVKDTSLPYKEACHLLDPAGVADLIRTHLKQTDREHFIAVFLDSNSKVIGINTISVGTLTESLVHPREVFKGAILANAASLICAHNHPSGIASASAADISVTQKLKEAGSILGIPVEDHVIIGDEGFTSFRQEGLL
jgi:DNA repair protein RadC